MKAKIKSTGEVKEVLNTLGDDWTVTYISNDGCVYQHDELQFQPEPFDIDWEQRQWDATVAAMQGLLAYGYNPEDAIKYAKELIKQYKGK